MVSKRWNLPSAGELMLGQNAAVAQSCKDASRTAPCNFLFLEQMVWCRAEEILGRIEMNRLHHMYTRSV